MKESTVEWEEKETRKSLAEGKGVTFPNAAEREEMERYSKLMAVLISGYWCFKPISGEVRWL
ncbi:hypothetical protein LCGC14_2475150 [marine sediment metagenome]|uniref:Uncharacterized protein n=1 Tax=marine sediment metagenome TaxID=412755 RepID=A0A0F9BA02_9ZZZZ